MLNGWALNINDEEERCAQGTCPDSERKDYCRSLNQNRSLEKVIKRNEKKRHFFIMMTRKTANCLPNFKVLTSNILKMCSVQGKAKGTHIIIMQTYLCSSFKVIFFFFLKFFFFLPLGFMLQVPSRYLWYWVECHHWTPKQFSLFFICALQ